MWLWSPGARKGGSPSFRTAGRQSRRAWVNGLAVTCGQFAWFANTPPTTKSFHARFMPCGNALQGGCDADKVSNWVGACQRFRDPLLFSSAAQPAGELPLGRILYANATNLRGVAVPTTETILSGDVLSTADNGSAIVELSRERRCKSSQTPRSVFSVTATRCRRSCWRVRWCRRAPARPPWR